MIDNKCVHMYSRGLGEPRPRLCEHCKEPEVCQACTGDGDTHMCCIVCTGVDNQDMKSEHTCAEFRNNKTIFVSPNICSHGYDSALDCIKCTPDHDKKKPYVLSKWEQRWVDRARYVAKYSKDKNTKTGAVIVDDDNTELVMGYNGFPRGADDDTDQRRYQKPMKYFWTEHAERNSLYKAARIGISTKGANMFCTYFPCADCSRGIIQGGIKKLYTEKPDFNHHKWGDSWVEAMIMLKECGVEVIWTNIDTKWYGQHLIDENMWYLTEHCRIDGILGEHFFETKEKLVEYTIENNIIWDGGDGV